MSQKVVQKIGKYEIVGELGQGGMGVVYKARDPLIGRLVALKTITPDLVSNPEILKRFYREAQSAGTLQHPNIVTVFDLGEFEGYPYIAMELVEGESLQNIIARRADIPLAVKLKLMEGVCLGLDHAHKNGVIHRDVKPANILVRNDGTVKVVDFGIVHLDSTTLTKTGMFMGTIQYASPEQLNEGHVDGRSDLWSVACVIYEFVSYKKPFEASNFGAIIGKILGSEPEPLSACCPGVPAELESLIAKGLKKNVQERYQSLDELLADLLPIERTLQRSLIGELLAEAQQMKGRGDLNGAREKVRAILILDRTHTEAGHLNSEIRAELLRLSSLPKVKELVSAGEQAFKRGEYADAIRLLAEALELNPNDTDARSLKERAMREQDRMRKVREALTAGQEAMKQGDLTAAEQELQKVLALDRDNPQASGLLKEIRGDRSSREKDFGLKEALWKTDKLVTEGKYDEAQRELAVLQKGFPEAEEVQQKLQALDQRRAGPAPAGSSPAAGPDAGKAQWREAQIAEVAISLAGDDLPRATMLLGLVQEQFPADAKVQALLQQVEERKTRTGAPAIKPAPPLGVVIEKPRRSMGMLLGGMTLALVLAVGGWLYYQHAHPAGGVSASPEEIQLEHDAKLLQDHGDLAAALSKWRDLASRKGALKNEADQAALELTRRQNVQSQEKALYSQGNAAQQQKKWDDAVALYQKVADLNGPMKDQALQAISSVKELESGHSAAGLEKEKYNQAVAALGQDNYARAQVLFQQVLDLNVPGSTFAAKAQTQLETVKALQQTQQEFAAGEKAQNSGDLDGALARFKDIAAKPGPLQAQAQSRLKDINQIVAANQQKQQGEKAFQDNLKKFEDLKSQKKYGDAAALLPTLGKTGGDANQLEKELESAEQADLQNLTNQFNQAKNNKDVASLQQLKSQFQTLAASSGAPASQARDYADNQIPSAISQITQANQPKAQPAAPPAPAPATAPAASQAHAPVVTLILSGTYRPWTRPVQKGMLVPEYNVEGGLRPLDLSLSAVPGAPAGSFVTIKINIDENGDVSPDIVLLDQIGVGPTIMDAAKKWKFNPPTVRGKPVKTSVTAKVSF